MTTTALFGLISKAYSDTDHLTITITIIIAAFGWIVALVLQNVNIKKQHKIQVQYDIYKDLLKSSTKAQSAIAELSASFPPLILMDSAMIPFKHKLKKEYKDQWIPISEQECLSDGTKIWQDFCKERLEKYFAFNDVYREMLVIFEGWASATEPLIPAQQVLIKELDYLQKRIYRRISSFQLYTLDHGDDWRTWDKEKIDTVAKRIQDDSVTISTYISDYMILVHNELVSRYFGYKRPIRKTLDPKYKVLTKEGLILRLEDNHEEKFKKILKQNKVEQERFLTEDL